MKVSEDCETQYEDHKRTLSHFRPKAEPGHPSTSATV
jgi:hypothetical protein